MEVIEHCASDSDAAAQPVAPVHGLQRLLQHPGMSRAILLVSMAITLLAVWAAHSYAQRERLRNFEQHAGEVHQRIASRMATYETLLRGGVALFVGTGEVTRTGWARFAETQAAQSTYPGIQGLGVAQRLSVAQLPGHIAAVRAADDDHYDVHPVGARDEYSSITLLHPLDERNRRAIGFDMHSEPVRREAMERARNTGRASLSGPVRLVQEDGRAEQSGVLVYLPLYRDLDGQFANHGQADDLWGWVYAPFRLGDLMTSILGELDLHVGVRLQDVAPDGRVADQPMFEYQAASLGPSARPDVRRTLELGGRRWQLSYVDSEVDRSPISALSATVALAGIAINLLLLQSIVVQARRSRVAEQIAVESQAQVQARSRWLDAVSGLSPDGALVFERDATGAYRLVFTNPSFSHLFGLRPSDLLGLSEPAVDEWLSGLGDTAHPLPALDASEVTMFLPGPPKRVLRRRQREEGTQRVYYFHDITQASELDRLKSEFITTAAHELRTPLASVYGFAEMLVDQMVPPQRREHTIGVIYRQAGVLKHLVDELMDLARLDSRGGRDFIRQTTDLREVAEIAIESVAHPNTGSRIHLQSTAEPLWAAVDVTKVRQVLVNLLSNAFKYSPAGSPVTVVLRSARQGERDMAVIDVTDQGNGMTAEQCARAFERFYRADPSGHVLGAGLGLSIAKEIVELHGGDIVLDSEPGVGTRVSLHLPLSTAPAPPVADEARVDAEAAATA